MRIAIVLLNYNGYKDTLKCLAALSKQTFTNFQIVLIDNGSNDFSIIELSRIKDVIFLREQTNHGFAGGVNIGIKYSM
ncbi:MAG: glycosyltransferase, partial [Candidatus Nomurabacteria bacterium]|nr:glycosyltransferase [Candidatus Nomurabacteria bacterium]